MVKVGDRVRFTDKCNVSWWFGPHTQYKTGTISKIYTHSRHYMYSVKVADSITPCYANKEHLELMKEEEEMYKYIVLFTNSGEYDLCKSIEEVQKTLSRYPEEMEEIEVWELGRKAKVDYKPTVTFPSIG